MIAPTLRWFGPDAWDDDGSAFGTDAHARKLIDMLGERADRPVAAWSYSCHVLLAALILRPDLVGSAFLYEPG